MYPASYRNFLHGGGWDPYIRAETIVRANARLVAHQTNIALAQIWGGGEVASADGLRFTVPVRTINARPNPKYFNVERGATYYNFHASRPAPAISPGQRFSQKP
jgi:TnpA family transposase